MYLSRGTVDTIEIPRQQPLSLPEDLTPSPCDITLVVISKIYTFQHLKYVCIQKFI